MKQIICKGLFLIISSLIVLIFAIFIISFNIQSDSPIPFGGWQLQTNLQTVLNGRTITDMAFIDSLTGFAVTNTPNNDTGFILKTTNGGNNWFINFSNLGPFGDYFDKIRFITDSVGYSCGGGGISFLCKTTNKGNIWIKTSYSSTLEFKGMSVLNKDTIYLCDDNGLTGGVFRSTNGGQNWLRIYSASQYNPRDIYMINANTGFCTDDASNFYKTINGGFSWTKIDSLGFKYIYFFDTLSGYRINTNDYGGILKTSNGGYNWIFQTLPVVPGGTNHYDIQRLQFSNKDTIWAVGGIIQYHNPNRLRGIINKTTNGGLKWGYQIPDTHNIIIPFYSFINFSGDKKGWAYYNLGPGIHTTTGGDSTIYVGINENSGIIPKDFILEQNYPNPFNPETKIKYQVPLRKGGSGVVMLKIFDITGKEIAILVNQKQNAGTYEVIFDGSNLPSGIYFYQLRVGTYSETKKMLLIK